MLPETLLTIYAGKNPAIPMNKEMLKERIRNGNCPICSKKIINKCDKSKVAFLDGVIVLICIYHPAVL